MSTLKVRPSGRRPMGSRQHGAEPRIDVVDSTGYSHPLWMTPHRSPALCYIILAPNDDILPYMRHRVSYMAVPPRVSESHAGTTAGPPKREPGFEKPPDEQHSHFDKVSIMNKLVPTILLAAAAALVACGGGSGMSSTTPPGSAPLMATGTITGFGSVYVNGVHFTTTSATIRKNRQVVAQSALKVGEIAHVKGSKNASDATGNADSVDVEENVVGPIATIGTNTITVLGQTVTIDAGTSFSSDVQPADITGLKASDFVEVSGMTAADGTIAATRIEREASAGTLQVLGTVASVDTVMHTFMINALIVDYSAANLTGFTSGQPANGDFVEVQGTTFASATTTLTATGVAKQMSDVQEAGDHGDMEREGLITR